MSKSFAAKEVASHKSVEEGLWIIIDNEVYDVTKFIDEHPGGPKILKRVAGKDASKQFWKYHGDNVLTKYKPKLCIGAVQADAKL
ncbi:cytochrome b5 [Tothia fuscella]|uniref:Cytochrome b5 n=1 Tax=Tothia fuscella TaxID=1048955 RepID=A0A9P4P2D8_9PEZI|nr:cytochrome b5 [Tothia fuscella]